MLELIPVVFLLFHGGDLSIYGYLDLGIGGCLNIFSYMVIEPTCRKA